ncbi:unnamed protein product, partial [Didymodactylos carnosus]
SDNCFFPFQYAGQWYERCISDTLNDSWCSVTDNFDRDHKWKYCRTPRIKTTGGTGNGSSCQFPFTYQGRSFSTCIYRSTSAFSFALFCSTTDNLDKDGSWGYCLDYESCYFPFIWNGQKYFDCVTGVLSARWCGTTSNFDRNRMWTNCPVTCDGYPAQDQNSVGFRMLSDRQPCLYKEARSQETGVILKYYTLPTCQLEPLCKTNYTALFQEIECREDGTYSYPIAICLPR